MFCINTFIRHVCSSLLSDMTHLPNHEPHTSFPVNGLINTKDFLIFKIKFFKFIKYGLCVSIDSTKRTELVNCQNDTEYLAKLHCLRSGFETICDNEANIKDLENTGLKVGCEILIALGYEKDSFENAYQRMIVFLHSPNSYSIIKEELSDRGVEIVSLYDILFDFILLDALESLENPPSSLVSVINNRWLSEGFKKTTLNSSIWTILLAKRKFLKYKSGFKAHFYDIMDAIGAPLAWSFLGSELKANQIANAFKDSLNVLIRYLYSDSPRLTTRFELAEDIMLKIKSLQDGLVNELKVIDADTNIL